MAAAGGAGALLDIYLRLQGVGELVTQLRSGANVMEELRMSSERANTAITELRTGQIFTGGTAGQVGALASAFGSLGLSVETMAQAAEGLRERLFNDPLAIGTFGRSVVPAAMGGPQNSAAILAEAVRILRETANEEERLLKARRLGLEVLLPLADLDQKHFDALMNEGRIRGGMVDEELRQLRAVEDSQKARLKALQEERDLERERSRLRFRNWFRDTFILPFEEWSNRGWPLPPIGGRGGASGTAQEQAKALRDNTQALRLLRDEFANGGPRAAGAMPGGLRLDALQKALETHTLRLGAFAL